MLEAAEHPLARKPRQSVLVSNPGMKFVIGLAAALCAVFSPRLIAALATDDANVGFVSEAYVIAALAFSVLVAVAVMFLEWELPRAPRDTFAMTLGLPAILAGALGASGTSRTVQQLLDENQKLGQTLSERTGIKIERTGAAGPTGQARPQGAFVDLLVVPAYAQAEDTVSNGIEPQYGVFVKEPQFHVVIDRAPKLEDAQQRMSACLARANQTNPQSPLSLRVERLGNEFLVVVAGGPRTKSAALLEAVRVKDTYHITPTLIEVESKK